MVDPVTLQTVKDVVAIFELIAGFTCFVMTVRISQKTRGLIPESVGTLPQGTGTGTRNKIGDRPETSMNVKRFDT